MPVYLCFQWHHCRAIAAGIAFSQPLGLGEHLLKASASSTPRIGGRMHSDTTTRANGQVSEWCGELIDTGHTMIQSLAKRFNLQLVDLLKAEPPGSGITFFFFGKYYTQAHANQDFKPVYTVLQSQLKAAPVTLYNKYTPTGYQLDHIGIYDWIEQYVPGGHSSDMGQLLDAAYIAEFGRESTDQSSLNLLYLLAYQPHPNHLSLYGISDERYRIVEGSQQLPVAIANSLPAGSVKLNWRKKSLNAP